MSIIYRVSYEFKTEGNIIYVVSLSQLWALKFSKERVEVIVGLEVTVTEGLLSLVDILSAFHISCFNAPILPVFLDFWDTTRIIRLVVSCASAWLLWGHNQFSTVHDVFYSHSCFVAWQRFGVLRRYSAGPRW